MNLYTRKGIEVVERKHVDFGLTNVTKTHGARQIGANYSITRVEYTPTANMSGWPREEGGLALMAVTNLTVGGDSWGPGYIRKEFPDTEAGLIAARKFLDKKVAEMRKRQSKKLEAA